jgi:hypothetical protein
LAWIAAVLVLSAVVPQAPPQIEDPIVFSQWLSSIPNSVRPMVERLRPFGVFNLLDSGWLSLPLTALFAHALVMLAALGPPVWYRVGSLSGEVGPLGKSFQLDRSLPELAQHVGQQIFTRLHQADYQVLFRPGGDASGQEQENFIAWRWLWSWVGLPAMYLGLGLVSLGLILQGWLGHVEHIFLEPDSPASLPVLSAPDLALQEVKGVRGNPFRPGTGVASMELSTEIGERKNFGLKLHNSRFLRGTWLTATDLRPMVEIGALDTETGEDVLLQPFYPRALAREQVRLSLLGDPELRVVGVPTGNVTLRVDFQVDGDNPRSIREILEGGRLQDEDRFPRPALVLSFFRGLEDRPILSETLNSGDHVIFDGVRYSVAFDYDVGLRISSSPWWAMAGIGGVVVALSLIALTLRSPVFVRASIQSVGEGSQVVSMADFLGDEQRRRRELQSVIAPESDYQSGV